MKNKKFKISLLVFLIVAFGFFLRIYNIDNTPPGVYPDEAVNGEDALRALKTGNYQWFYTANNGREGFFMNFIALCFSLFGVSILTLKLPAIIFSTLSIWGTYLFTKEIFNRRLAFISSFLVAFSFWSINFGRISFRANMLPAILVFSFYFLFKGLYTKKWYDFAFGGAIFGFGMHSYIAWRIAPLILIAFLFFLIINRKKFIRDYWILILTFLFASLIIAFPMIYTYLSHPEYLESRSASVSIFSPEANGGSATLSFLRSFSLSLIKYTFVGDMNWRHNFKPYPILNPLVGLAFLFGIIFSIKMFFKSLFARIKNNARTLELEKYSFLLLWFFAMLAPEFLTAEGNPHALRSIGTLPVAFIFAGITFEYLFDISKKFKPASRKFTLCLIILILIFVGIFDVIKYHIVWANKERVAYSFNKNLTDISRFINDLPIDTETYVVTSYNTLEKLPIQIFNKGKANHYLLPNELNKINPKDKNNFYIFFTENNQGAIEEVWQKFPQLQRQTIRLDRGSIFYILTTN